jgi:integrative and conjugative element protein (TIGR02256 family)
VAERGDIASSIPPTRLSVHRAVTEHLQSLCAAPWEIGGWLLGYWTEVLDHVVVTHATPPGRRGTPFGVRISGQGHRARFDQAWDASGGHVTFLGDWHTHPGGPALPSTTDRRALDKLASNPDYGTPTPLIAIIQNPRFGWSSTPRRVAWFVRADEDEPRVLAPARFESLPHCVAAVPNWAWPVGRRNRRRLKRPGPNGADAL